MSAGLRQYGDGPPSRSPHVVLPPLRAQPASDRFPPPELIVTRIADENVSHTASLFVVVCSSCSSHCIVLVRRPRTNYFGGSSHGDYKVSPGGPYRLLFSSKWRLHSRPTHQTKVIYTNDGRVFLHSQKRRCDIWCCNKHANVEVIDFFRIRRLYRNRLCKHE